MATVGMIPPPGYANPQTPSFAGVKCGTYLQDENFESEGTVPLDIGFALPTTWSDTESFTSIDGGFAWTCNTTGIYNISFNQQLTITNVPEVGAVGDPVIPSSLFYLNMAASGAAPQSAPMDVTPATPGSSKVINATGTGAVLMATFTSPAAFLTSTNLPASTWVFSQWASTEDESENTNLYFDVYSVDADGSGNPTLIKSGSANPTLIPNISDLVTFSLAVPNTVLVDLTKRIQVRAYVVFGTAEAAYLYYGGSTVSNVLTFLSQEVPLPAATVKDTVNLEISISSPTTTEFSQVFRTSIPVTLLPEESFTYSASVNCMANVDAGSLMTCTVTSFYGTTFIVSGYAALPSPQGSLQWNLLAQGAYGNQGILAEEAVPLVVAGEL